MQAQCELSVVTCADSKTKERIVQTLACSA